MNLHKSHSKAAAELFTPILHIGPNDYFLIFFNFHANKMVGASSDACKEPNFFLPNYQ